MTSASARRLQVGEHCRVIVDNDWAGDPDGLLALAHHLLSPTNRVTLVTSSFLNPMFGPSAGTAERGAMLARGLLELTGHGVEVVAGPDAPFDAGGSEAAVADGIVAEAMREDPLPLFLVCGGPLTNVAHALRREPRIAERLTLVWVGGAIAPGEFEYNRDTDAAAADFVLGVPGLTVLQFPLETYRRCGYSVAELEADLAGSGLLGAWLWDRFLELPLPPEVRLPGVWALGDSLPVLITALNDTSSTYTADGPNRRVYTDVDLRLLVGDLLARLRLHERSSSRP